MTPLQQLDHAWRHMTLGLPNLPSDVRFWIATMQHGALRCLHDCAPKVPAITSIHRHRDGAMMLRLRCASCATTWSVHSN